MPGTLHHRELRRAPVPGPLLSASRLNRTLLVGLYLLAALLLFQPLVEWGMAVWPPHPIREAWRYGALGTLSGSLLTPILGAVLAAALARWLGHRRLLRVLAAAAIVGGLVLLMAGPVFVLDTIQLRVRVPEAGQTRYLMESIRTLGRLLAAGGVLVLLGFGGWRLEWRGQRRHPRAAHPGGESAPVIVRRRN